MELDEMGLDIFVATVQDDAELLSTGCPRCDGNNRRNHTCSRRRNRSDWGPPRARSTRQRTVGPAGTAALLPASQEVAGMLQPIETPLVFDAALSTTDA